MRRKNRWALVLVVSVAVLGLAGALRRVSDANSPSAVAMERRDELRTIRAQLDACVTTQDRVEMRFEALTQSTDSLRRELDVLESIDARGVPAERYARYLGLVDEFNASVSEWERQSGDLRETEARCRSLIGLHNERADSLQRYLVETGIWEESWLPGASGVAGENDEGPPAAPEGPR